MRSFTSPSGSFLQPKTRLTSHTSLEFDLSLNTLLYTPLTGNYSATDPSPPYPNNMVGGGARMTIYVVPCVLWFSLCIPRWKVALEGQVLLETS